MHIVVVDPSRTVLKFVSRMLELRGHRVSVFSEGGEAIAFIKDHDDVNALITSCELNDMTGMELCWEARLATGPHRSLYIVLMSSSHDQHKISEALDSGADDFIGKPPVAEEIYARLRAAERLEAKQCELIHLATTDSLTGLLNRRAFFERAEAAFRIDAEACALSAVMFDIDHFKRVNDNHGHDVGDDVLRRVATEAGRADAAVGRLGGEEFAMILEGTCLQAAVEIADLLRVNIAAISFEVGGATLSVTCSFGVAEREPGDTVDRLLKRSDIALYSAKQGGRNRVVAADAAVMTAPSHESITRSTDRHPLLAQSLSR
jgi:diguanylate cyclase (GGDEF)-like protein